MAVRRELITTAIPNEGELFGDQIIPTTRIVWLLFVHLQRNSFGCLYSWRII